MTRDELEQTKLEILGSLEELLMEQDSEYTVVDILNMIYDESDKDDFQDLIRIVDDGDFDQDKLDLVSEAWNHFPHKALGGIAPVEVMNEYSVNKNPNPNG